jgi:chromosome segregation ATPase
MANQANITSTEALESFRACLIVFLTKARRALDEVSEEVRRTRHWLQNDQRTHWEGELRRRKKKLEQAEQELMSARLSTHQEATMMARQMAVVKAQRDIGEVEGKLRKLKSWNQNYDSSADPLVKQMERLRQLLNDLPKAIAYLAAAQKTLDAYAERSAPVGAPMTAPSLPESGEQP